MSFLVVLQMFLTASLGTPYDYGGTNPITGYDCSGFVTEFDHTFGVGPSDRLSAQHIYDWFESHPNERIPQWATDISGMPPVGTLVFFGEATWRITHIAVIINDSQMVEAGGGDRTVLTKSEAATKNAFVRIRPFKGRHDWVAFILPRYPVSSGYYQDVHMTLPKEWMNR